MGNTWNLIIKVQVERIPKELIGAAFELNFSFGQITTMACPIISKMDEPIPTIYCSCLCILAILLMASMDAPKYPESYPEQTLLDEVKENTISILVDTKVLPAKW